MQNCEKCIWFMEGQSYRVGGTISWPQWCGAGRECDQAYSCPQFSPVIAVRIEEDNEYAHLLDYDAELRKEVIDWVKETTTISKVETFYHWGAVVTFYYPRDAVMFALRWSA